MGAIPPTLKRTLGRQPERSESKTFPTTERSDMDILPVMTTTSPVHNYFKATTPIQLVHVYRHVDFENLESDPSIWTKLNKLLVAIDIDCPPHVGDRRGEHSSLGEHELFGGSL